MTKALRFTGTQVNYYAVCHRKLWLVSHDIQMEHENDNVTLGRLLDEDSYQREHKGITLNERVRFDWVELKDNADGSKTLHEVKKAKSVEAAHRLQMLYYLLCLREKGVAARGQLDYPLLKRTERIELTAPAEAEVEAALDDIESIVESDAVPPRLPQSKKPFCSQCAFFELCWS